MVSESLCSCCDSPLMLLQNQRILILKYFQFKNSNFKIMIYRLRFSFLYNRSLIVLKHQSQRTLILITPNWRTLILKLGVYEVCLFMSFWKLSLIEFLIQLKKDETAIIFSCGTFSYGWDFLYLVLLGSEIHSIINWRKMKLYNLNSFLHEFTINHLL